MLQLIATLVGYWLLLSLGFVFSVGLVGLASDEWRLREEQRERERRRAAQRDAELVDVMHRLEGEGQLLLAMDRIAKNLNDKERA